MPTSTRTPSSEVRRLPVLSANPTRTSLRQRACLGTSSRGRPSGFTLLELSIVLLVLAIAASFVIPRLRDAQSAALQASAARLAATARLLYEEAAFRRTPMRLNLDLDKQVYWVTVLRDDLETPEFVPDAAMLTRPVALPDAVVFADVVLPALGTVKEGIVFAQFFPEGYADPLLVHLMNRRNEYATMAIEPLTGRTRVGDGYIDLGGPRLGEPRRAADARSASE